MNRNKKEKNKRGVATPSQYYFHVLPNVTCLHLLEISEVCMIFRCFHSRYAIVTQEKMG